MLDTEQATIASPKVLTVSELNRMAKEVLEQSFPLFWVSG
jgi:exodeoxyribonuclease VII large subunit